MTNPTNAPDGANTPALPIVWHKLAYMWSTTTAERAIVGSYELMAFDAPPDGAHPRTIGWGLNTGPQFMTHVAGGPAASFEAAKDAAEAEVRKLLANVHPDTTLNGTPKKTLTLEEVSFFSIEKKRFPPRNFWAVNPPDDYGEACEYGRNLAITLLRVSDIDFTDLLGFVVFDQIRRGFLAEGDKGTLVGFWDVIGKIASLHANAAMADRIETAFAERKRASEAKMEQDRQAQRQAARARALHASKVAAAKRKAVRSSAPTVKGD